MCQDRGQAHLDCVHITGVAFARKVHPAKRSPADRLDQFKVLDGHDQARAPAAEWRHRRRHAVQRGGG
eukprot:269430-Chlamydomonas_euryale.AAC.1